MKKFFRSLVMALITFLMFMSTVNVFAKTDSNDSKAYMKSYEKILEIMKKNMEDSPTTGDATVDFLYVMIPHHEAAISMAEDVLKYGSNEEIKNKAQIIIDEQSNEITKMQNLLKNLKDNLKVDIDSEKEYLKVYEDAYKEMISQMESVKDNGNIDKHFLQVMIFHHEGAVKMAESILKHTYNDEVKNMAEKMIQVQNSEINEFKELLEKIK